jgi:hypothetical protein
MPLGDRKPLTDPARFFRVPASPRHRQYEALRAYFVEDRLSAEVARSFGYSPGAFRVLCHQFRHDPHAREIFVSASVGRPPGVRRQNSVREQVVALRKKNYSVRDISHALGERGLRVTPAAARDILREEGFAPLPRRLDEERPEHLGPTIQPIADVRQARAARPAPAGQHRVPRTGSIAYWYRTLTSAPWLSRRTVVFLFVVLEVLPWAG